jgi:hypothetical protein
MYLAPPQSQSHMKNIFKFVLAAFSVAAISSPGQASEGRNWFLQKEEYTMEARACAQGSRDSETYEKALRTWIEKHKVQIDAQQKRLPNALKDAMISDIQAIESAFPDPDTDEFSKFCAKLLAELQE